MNTGLRVEIQQARPLKSHTQEAFLNLMRTAAAFEDALQPLGVTATQYNVLRIPKGAGKDGLWRNDIIGRMITLVPDATRLLDRIESFRSVARRRSADGRRFVTARISSAGLGLSDEMEGPVTELHEAQLGHLTVAELQQLGALMDCARSAGCVALFFTQYVL